MALREIEEEPLTEGHAAPRHLAGTGGAKNERDGVAPARRKVGSGHENAPWHLKRHGATRFP